jgi:hypothetical protein
MFSWNDFEMATQKGKAETEKKESMRANLHFISLGALLPVFWFLLSVKLLGEGVTRLCKNLPHLAMSRTRVHSCYFTEQHFIWIHWVC